MVGSFYLSRNSLISFVMLYHYKSQIRPKVKSFGHIWAGTVQSLFSSLHGFKYVDVFLHILCCSALIPQTQRHTPIAVPMFPISPILQVHQFRLLQLGHTQSSFPHFPRIPIIRIKLKTETYSPRNTTVLHIICSSKNNIASALPDLPLLR